jgi:hypothetical protein
VVESRGLLRLAELQKQAGNRKVFGLFLRTNLVGVSCWMMGVGPCSGTLAGTPAPDAIVCLVGTHRDNLRASEVLGPGTTRRTRSPGRERGIGFEEIVFRIERGDLLDILEHPNPERYGGQRIFVVRREDYVYLVPFVEDDQTVFLKTIIPSRKATKEYLGEESDDET